MSLLPGASVAIAPESDAGAKSGGMHFEEENDRLPPPVLLQYWHTILRWRLVLAAIVGAALIVGVIYTMLTAPLYTARAQMQIDRQQKKVTNVQGLDEAVGGQDVEFYATQYTLLKAVSLAERVAASQKLVTRPEFFAAHGAKQAKTPEGRQRQVVGLLLGHIGIEPVRTSRLVNVTYTSRAPTISAELCNAWMREFIGATMDREYASTADARRFLEQRLGALQSRLEQSEKDAVTYASANNIVTLEAARGQDGKTQSQRTLATADLEALATALTAAQTERMAAQSRVAAGGAETSSDALSNVALGAIRQKRADVAAEYAKVLAQFEPGYPTARALKQQLDNLDASIARFNARIGTSRQQQYREALAKENALRQQVEVRKSELDRQNRARIQYNIYQRDADTNRQLYDALLQRYKEIGVAGAVGASNIAIVDRAQVPAGPSAPNMTLNIALSFLMGLGLAALAVLILEQVNEGIRSPADVWNLLKLPLLGNVPKVERNLRDALSDPKSSFSEAYFSIRSNLAFATTHGLPRSLALTSSQASEGKSTSALAIADIIGRTGKSVILVDADLRSPSVHQLVGTDNSAGLSNLLTGDDDIAGVTLATDIKGLSVIPTGPVPPSPAELLSSDRLSNLINRLLEQYDHVVIDAPPVLGLADSPLICRVVEGCVFVTEPGRSSLRGIRSALQRLRFAGARIFGVIVTKIDMDRQHYGYSYGQYGYGYGYGDHGVDS